VIEPYTFLPSMTLPVKNFETCSSSSHVVGGSSSRLYCCLNAARSSGFANQSLRYVQPTASAMAGSAQ
jgi:hypothetical protein